MIDLNKASFKEMAEFQEKIAQKMREVREEKIVNLAEQFESMAGEYGMTAKAVLSEQKGRRKQGRKPNHPALSVVEQLSGRALSRGDQKR